MIMTGLGVSFLLVCFFIISLFLYMLRSRNIHIWFSAYVLHLLKRKIQIEATPIYIFFCVVDHFEPRWNHATYEQECQRVDIWVKQYPIMALNHRDSRGRPYQHTFFYPEEEYRTEHLDKLARIHKNGFGDVEIHLHHNNDTSQNLRETLIRFKTILHDTHGLLHKNRDTGNVEYGFIHGNWALDNSRPDGKWCGVNDELIILRETGCYADFTYPSAPDVTQTQKINSIYYATDDPQQPKSHNTGIDVEVNRPPSGDLMIIQGILTLNWRTRKWGIFPRIENSELSGDNPPVSSRVDLWIQQHIHVSGQPKWIFVKLHTHGAQEENCNMLLGEPMNKMLSYLETTYNDGIHYKLYYVTARELYGLIKAAEKGENKEPDQILEQMYADGGNIHS
ncbi:hypothetical protein U27_06412 [Candidatus Vecturithrix granuli]|uniref:Uncharacterized protein n=1 Tax=Vecturithrix granuli TaxID=1499967 RepID=A0A081C4C3_VECG1|nr:hypothetical protein U27_06412 [Candidatus Vecturithrix granuli]